MPEGDKAICWKEKKEKKRAGGDVGGGPQRSALLFAPNTLGLDV